MALFGNASSGATTTLKRVRVPSIEELRIILQQLVLQGQITPEEAQTILQEPSAFLGITEDPALRASQMDTLSSLQSIVDAEGLDPQAEADLMQIQGGIDTTNRAAQQAILANARERGVSGSGLELANQLLAQQSQAQQGSMQGFETARLAEQRRLAALGQVAEQGTAIRTQDLAKQQAAAQAQDIINNFNAANRQTQETANVDRRNVAQTANLAEKQRVADTNVALQNEQEQYNKSVLLDKFQADLAKATAVAQAQEAKNARQRENTGQILKSISGVISPSISSMSDRRAKTDIQEFDSRAFLDKLVPYKYHYKDPEQYGDGEQNGIMAQDLEKTDQAEAVVTNPDGMKGIDYDKLGGPILATLADMNNRMKKLEGQSAVGERMRKEGVR